MRNGFGAPGRGHPSSPRSRNARHVAHGHPSRSSIRPIRATWPSANRIVKPSSRLTSRSTGSLLSSTAPGCLIPAQTTLREGPSTKPFELAQILRQSWRPPCAAPAPTDLSRTHPASRRTQQREPRRSVYAELSTRPCSRGVMGAIPRTLRTARVATACWPRRRARRLLGRSPARRSRARPASVSTSDFATTSRRGSRPCRHRRRSHR